MRQDFEGGIYWDKLAEICGNISRIARFQVVARFRANMVAHRLPKRLLNYLITAEKLIGTTYLISMFWWLTAWDKRITLVFNVGSMK